ncbi:MAG TPA: RsmE family RNA methyltransferase [Candidatus Paceibacterota bacterium]|nr:RsmE family RNA methyltransferase [Verrucomicrobiota bacterium]HSA10083.1 RsmE family RNA methyltransferase [Candidatus Paceibacterota bacterium]
MHRFYLPPDQCQGRSVLLTGAEAHHALHVLRVRRADQVTVLDGEGHELLCEVEATDHDRTRLTVVETLDHPAPASRITLLQAVPKGRAMETIIQKATELGVSRIVPLLSERVVAQIGEQDGALKVGKWRLIAREAIKQCGFAWLPEIELPMTPDQFLARKENIELPLIASLESGSRLARAYFQAFHTRHRRMPGSVCVWIGPEGDFTPAESRTIKSQGALAITLGPRVLRTETAALCCLTIVNYELQTLFA